MKKRSKEIMRNHYDFTSGARGKYAKRYAEGANVIILEPDVAEFFHDSKVVNETLRALAKVIRLQQKNA